MAGRVTLGAKAQRLQPQLHSGNSSDDRGLERQGPHGEMARSEVSRNQISSRRA